MNTKKSLLFTLGRVVITPALLELFQKGMIEPAVFLTCHQSGNFGELCTSDVETNMHAILNRFRVLSCYHLGKTKFWIITEADRSSTTMLLPDEY